MKARLFALLILPSLMLPSCAGLFGPKSTEQEVMAYDLDRASQDRHKRLKEGYLTTVKARFVENQPYIPYLSLRQYASLYESHYGEGFTNKITNTAFSTSWEIYKGDEPYFACVFDYLSEEISIAGSINNAFSETDDTRDLKALSYGLKNTYDNKILSNKSYATYNYGGYGITNFKSGNDRYFPLGFYDITFFDNSGIYFTYNYKYICSTRNVDTYSDFTYVEEDGTENTFNSQMLSNKQNDVIPSYLSTYNANLFLYLMDNFYGLKENKGFKSAATYYKNKGFYNDLFVEDPEARTWAYSDALSVLDDNHTALVSVNSTWGNQYYKPSRRYGDGCRARNATRGDLEPEREDNYTRMQDINSHDVVISSDKKTAFFSFDSFTFGTTSQVFNEDGTVKGSAKDFDTFFKMIDVLQYIKSVGTVENVILDVSLNGGGTVGVMMKLLALISKDNNSNLAMYDGPTTQLVNINSQVDINGDGVYDTEDCFGDDFNFYILTSDCSFSCGNAFPCVAKAEGYAKIIGQKSGGGECAVSIHYLPNSEYVYHSSNTHLGLYDQATNTFKGFENGAIPDIDYPFVPRYYMIDNLNTVIQNSQK